MNTEPIWLTVHERQVLEQMVKSGYSWPINAITLMLPATGNAVNQLIKKKLLKHVKTSFESYAMTDEAMKYMGVHEDHGEHLPFPMMPHPRRQEDAP